MNCQYIVKLIFFDYDMDKEKQTMNEFLFCSVSCIYITALTNNPCPATISFKKEYKPI